MNNTSSGSVAANDTLMFATVPELPFGGVCESGCGCYHGKHSFTAFSHMKAVMVKDFSLESVNTLRYPPFTEKKTSWLNWLVGKSFKERSNSGVILAVIAAGIGIGAYAFRHRLGF